MLTCARKRRGTVGGKARGCMLATQPSPDLATAATHLRLQKKLSEKLTNSEPSEPQKCCGTEITFSFQTKISFPKKLTNPHGSMNNETSVFMSCIMPSRPGPQLVLVAPFPGARVKDKPFNQNKTASSLAPPDSLHAKCSGAYMPS